MPRLPLALLLSAVFASSALAQEGTVLYEVTTTMDVQLPPEMEHLRAQFPSTTTATRRLVFDADGALETEAPPSDDAPAPSESRVRLLMQRAGSVLYTDFDEGSRLELVEFLGRTFLVREELTRPAWRLTGEEGEFLGYPVQKAVLTRDSVTVEAWFTPQIPVSAGPGEYGQLPGLILTLTEDGGRRSYVAREVSLEPLAEGTIAPPTEGRRVTRQEYDRIVREKVAELGSERGPGGVTIIRAN